MPERRPPAPPDAPVDTTWHNAAACRDVGSDLFFGPEYEEPEAAHRRLGTAQRICASCPVATRCLDQALELGERYGIWGGLTPRQRKALARRRRGARQVTTAA